MARMMLIDALEAEETRVVITDDGEIEHFDFITKSKKQIKGNIYLGKVTRIEPSLQAAFVEYGGEKQGFLPFSEIHPDYYQIPVEDRKRLLEEAEAAAERRERESDDDGMDEDGRRPPPPVDAAVALTVTDEVRTSGIKRRGRRKPLRRGTIAEAADGDDRLIASENVEDGLLSNEVESALHATGVLIQDDSQYNNGERGDGGRGDGHIERTEHTNTEHTQAQEGDILPPLPVDDAITNVRDSRQSPQREREEDDGEDYDSRSPRQVMSRRYKIQEVMRPGQLVLIQVIKEERGNKGVSISTFISLAGRYCVLMPNSPRAGGISRKIASGEDRKRLKEISEELKDIRGMNAIIRTAGIDRTRAEIKRDYEYLIKLWNQVREDALASIAPATVYEENDIIKRSIRDHYNGDMENIYVEGEASYRLAKDFMKMLTPSHAPRVKQYKEPQPIFTAYNIEPQLSELYHSTAPLRSGGYIVINPTEALISIDVNSGKSTTERNVEETAYKTNLEACDEIARQLRLRNLGGLVVIDFIDMSYHKNRRHVEKAMKDALKEDRARIQVGHISTFGLMELSRQRMGSSIEETTTQACATCNGSGRTMLPETIVMQIFRNLQSFLADNTDSKAIILSISRHIMVELFNNYRTTLKALEDSLEISIQLELHPDNNDNAYVFKGKSGVKFDSTDTAARKSGARAKKGRANTSRRPRLNEDNVIVEGAEVKPEPQADRKQPQHANQRPERRPNPPIVAKEAMGDGEVGADVPRIEGAEEGEVREGRSRSRNRNRRRRGGANREGQQGNEVMAEDGQVDVHGDAEAVTQVQVQDQVQADTVAPVTDARPTLEPKAKPAPRAPRREQPSAERVAVERVAADRIIAPPIPSVSKDITIIAEIPQLTSRADAVISPPEDTPTPSDRRKGWWQRVIDG